MDLQQILNDNYKGENNSFLYYLHEENHFDPNDYSRINDLPLDYNEKLELLDTAVAQYFNADFSPSNPQ